MVFIVTPWMSGFYYRAFGTFLIIGYKFFCQCRTLIRLSRIPLARNNERVRQQLKGILAS